MDSFAYFPNTPITGNFDKSSSHAIFSPEATPPHYDAALPKNLLEQEVPSVELHDVMSPPSSPSRMIFDLAHDGQHDDGQIAAEEHYRSQLHLHTIFVSNVDDGNHVEDLLTSATSNTPTVTSNRSASFSGSSHGSPAEISPDAHTDGTLQIPNLLIATTMPQANMSSSSFSAPVSAPITNASNFNISPLMAPYSAFPHTQQPQLDSFQYGPPSASSSTMSSPLVVPMSAPASFVETRWDVLFGGSMSAASSPALSSVSPSLSAMSPVTSPHMGGVSLSSRNGRPVKEQKRFVCGSCGAGFARQHDLKRHMFSHVTERPLKCSRCGRGFLRKDALRRHEQGMIQGKKVRCLPMHTFGSPISMGMSASSVPNM